MCGFPIPVGSPELWCQWHFRSRVPLGPHTPIAFLRPVAPATQESAMTKLGRYSTTSANVMQRRFINLCDAENQC
jgi:hypothetical protein